MRDAVPHSIEIFDARSAGICLIIEKYLTAFRIDDRAASIKESRITGSRIAAEDHTAGDALTGRSSSRNIDMRTAGARGAFEIRFAAACAADRTGVVVDSGTARSRGVEKKRKAAACTIGRAAVVVDDGTARSRGVVKIRFAAVCVGRGAVVVNGGTARGRGVIEIRKAAVCATRCAGVVVDGGTARGRGVVEIRCAAVCVAERAAVIVDGGAARGRGIFEVRYAAVGVDERGAVVGEYCHAARRRAVMEDDRAKITGAINGSDKVLCYSRIVGDTHAADGQRKGGVGGDGVGAGSRIKINTIDFSVSGERDSCVIRWAKNRRVTRAVRHSGRCPVPRRIPVAGRI